MSVLLRIRGHPASMEDLPLLHALSILHGGADRLVRAELHEPGQLQRAEWRTPPRPNPGIRWQSLRHDHIRRSSLAGGYCLQDDYRGKIENTLQFLLRPPRRAV